MLNFNKSYINYSCPLIFGSNNYIYEDYKGINRYFMKDIYDRNEDDKLILNDFYDIYYDDYVKDTTNINTFSTLIPNLEFYKKYETDLKNIPNLGHWYNHGLNEFHRISNVNYIEKYAKFKSFFIAGTIFGFNTNFLNLFKKYNLSYENSILEAGYLINDLSRKTHSWEYYFGMICLKKKGVIIGINNDKYKLYKLMINEKKRIYSKINIPFNKSKIAFFLFISSDVPNSGGYRTLLKYINYLNSINYSVDIYIGNINIHNKKSVKYNSLILNHDGMPSCINWIKNNE